MANSPPCASHGTERLGTELTAGARHRNVEAITARDGLIREVQVALRGRKRLDDTYEGASEIQVFFGGQQ